MTLQVSPPRSPCVAVRMLSVVAGYGGGGVCLSMRWGTPGLLVVRDRANQAECCNGWSV